MLQLKDAAELVLHYAKRRITAQARAVSFIVIYLLIFQSLVLNLSIEDLPKIAVGISLVILGLTLFIEGLVLGIMPIGESLGLKLPRHLALPWILLFALILGLGATFAEPAIGILRAMGSSIAPERAPLLFYILKEKSDYLIGSIGIGVGVAVVLGMLRFFYHWSLKPLVYPLVLMCLGLSVFALFEPHFSHLLGLAWDCGAVTTGPVTVPLVLALGLGISRVTKGHSAEGTSSGFGVVTLASLLPIIAVLLLGLYYFYEGSYLSVLSSVNETSIADTNLNFDDFTGIFKKNFIIATQAILPLCFLIFFVFRLILREKFKYLDEILVGIALSLVGLTLFNIGNQLGLGKLGKQVGNVLPAAYSSIELTEHKRTLNDFDLDSLQTRYNEYGQAEKFFLLQKGEGNIAIRFLPEMYNSDTKSYTHIPVFGPIWGENEFDLIGLIVVLLFAFLMGYGATLAEPALNTLAATVENISVGTFKKTLLIHTVAIGVGLGILLGISKIIWNIPLFWLLTPFYLFLLILTYFSSEEFVNIGWDSAGVTTGPITVPLVLAMGLGIGNQAGMIEGFGILAMASVCPIMSVLIMGIVVSRSRARRVIEDQLVEEKL